VAKVFALKQGVHRSFVYDIYVAEWSMYLILSYHEVAPHTHGASSVTFDSFHLLSHREESDSLLQRLVLSWPQRALTLDELARLQVQVGKDLAHVLALTGTPRWQLT